jgi:hypothetical protein
MSVEQGRFDGFPIALYEGKFTGTFDLDEQMGENLVFDEVATWIVTTRCSGASFSDTKLGDIKRVNTFQVTSSVVLDQAMAAQLLKGVGVVPRGQRTIQDALSDVDSDVDSGDDLKEWLDAD